MKKDTNLGPSRERDAALMLDFWDLEYKGTTIKRLNRVKKFLCLIHKSRAVVRDGIALLAKVHEKVEE